MIRCVTVTPSTEDPVSLEEVKLWLKVDDNEVEDDDLIRALVATATRRMEERHNRAFLKATFDAYLDAVPECQAIRLPRAPLVSITSVKGYGSSDLTDTGGTAMSSSGYYADTASEPGRLVLTGDVAWPTATRDANALIIRFVAGESTSTTGVQERVKSDIKQLVARLYEHRGDELEQAKVLDAYDAVPSDLSLPEWG